MSASVIPQSIVFLILIPVSQSMILIFLSYKVSQIAIILKIINVLILKCTYPYPKELSLYLKLIKP